VGTTPLKRLEIDRVRVNARIAAGDASFVAIAADHPVAEADVPVFDLDAIPAIADFVEKATGLR
jgi:molybdopterin-guanine dinucleotide biosynthesis adapter protein